MTNTAIDALKFAWCGEIYGIAFFQQFVDHYPSRHEVWRTLYDIEIFTERYLRQRLAGLVRLTDAEQESMRRKGVEEATAWLTLPWPVLCPQMRDWVAPWQEKYAQWHQQAQQWQSEFAVIAMHENAIFDFWQAAACDDENAMERLQVSVSRLQRTAV